MTEKSAQRLALAVPALLLAGAYISQYGFGLFPCEMCWWQRWPHFAAVPLAIISFVAPPRRLWIGLAGIAILASGLTGFFHAGVEYGWWEGITSCSTALPSGGNALENILNAPIIRCDIAPWSLVGISLAGWNGLISTASALLIFSSLLSKEAKA